MKIQRIILVSIVTFTALCTCHARLFSQNSDKISIALVDTCERDRYLYKPVIDILQTVGFDVTYKSLDLIIDQSLQRLALPRYQAVFFIFGLEFLSGMTKSYLCAKVLQVLEQYACMPGVLIGLIFPSLRASPGMNVIGSLMPIFSKLGFPLPEALPLFASIRAMSADKNKQSINTFLFVTNTFLSTPIESRPMMYHTTLNMPHNGIEFDITQIEQTLRMLTVPVLFLPVKNDCSVTMRQTLPYGLYWYNPVRKNHFFISTTPILTFSSIAENFHICPMDFALRHEMLSMVQRMLWEVGLLSRVTDHTAFDEAFGMIKKVPTPSLSKDLASLGVKKPENICDDRKIAWMELNAFFDPTQEELKKDPDIIQKREEQQNKLIDYVYQSGLDALWITFNPHMYYSPIARLAGKENDFLHAISVFTQKLKNAATWCKCTVPKILVGYEITNNIYEPNLPQHYAVDLYENVYKDLPIPTDNSFWRQEITKPLETFVKKWKDPAISHGVPLAGIVLDLEMYCRKKSGSFLTTMGFDAGTFSKFVQARRLPWNSVALRDRILLLLQHSQAGSYFNFLEQQAESIGNSIAYHCKRLIPRCSIMCYLPNLSVSWFYKGLFKGLTNGKQPLYLLTFNSEFCSHEEWFKKNRIPAYHSSVLLLAKVGGEQDFEWVDYLLQHNHGLWLNRFSRFVEPKLRDWTSVEQPAMPEECYEDFMTYLQER